MNNGIKRGARFGWRFLWRLVILGLIGYLHSLFYRGDILTVYCFLGIFLIPFYKISNRGVLLCATLLFLGVARAIVFLLTNGDSIWGGSLEFGPNAVWVAEYFEVLKNGSLMDVFKTNAFDGHRDKWDFQYGFFGRGYFTFAFFLVGLYAGSD